MRETNTKTEGTRTFTVGVYVMHYGDVEVEARNIEEAEEMVRHFNAFKLEQIADPELGFLISTSVCGKCPEDHPYGCSRCKDPECAVNNLHSDKSKVSPDMSEYLRKKVMRQELRESFLEGMKERVEARKRKKEKQ